MTTNNPGNAKRWLTSGLTPPGWVSPGPQCTIKNSAGTVPIFVQINRVEAARLRNEDYNVTYDLLNGGTAHPLLGDTTFNIIDSDIVGNYSSSCLSLTDPTCYGRMHSEIDRDWKAAGYCGTGTVCDNATLLQQVKPVSTLIDVQGFVYWDDDHIIDSWHQFNGWELHPITAWKLDNALQPETISFNWSPTNPVVGQPVTFKAQVYGGKPNSVLSWDFGDGGTTISQGSTVSHLYLSRATFTVRVNTLDLQGMTVSDQRRIAVGSWNNAVGCSPVLTSLENLVGQVMVQRIQTDPGSTGTDYSGGGFQLTGSLPYGSNPLKWPFFKRDLNPPCTAKGTQTFVELHNVTVVGVNHADDCGTGYSGDNGGTSYPNGQNCSTSFNLVKPDYADNSACPVCYAHRLYAVIDRDWNASGTAPVAAPVEGSSIDVQGFVYWNSANINASWHSYTGWELHPVTAWRYVPTTPPSKGPTAGIVSSFEGKLFGYQNGTLTLIGQPATTALRQIAWKPDGSYALIVGDSAALFKWDGTNLTQISTAGVIPQGNDLNTIAWRPDGSYAIMGGTDGFLLKYDGTTLTRVSNPDTHQVQSISWSPDGRTALVVGNGGSMIVYQNGLVNTVQSSTTSDLYSVAWNPNGQYALAGGTSGVLIKYTNGTLTAFNTAGVYTPSAIIKSIAWNDAGTQSLIVADAGGIVLSYDGASLSSVSPVTSNGLFSVVWSGNAATIVGNGGTIVNYAGGGLVLIPQSNPTNSFRGIAMKPGPKRPAPFSAKIISVNPSNPNQGDTVTLTGAASGGVVPYSFAWDYGDGTVATGTIVTHKFAAGTINLHLAVTDFGGSVLVASQTLTVTNSTTPPAPISSLLTTFEGQVYKYSSANNSLALIGSPVSSALRQIAWKPDHSYALIVGDSAILLKWDGIQLTQIPIPISSGTDLNTVAWSPDGSYALIGGTDGFLLNYNGATVTRLANPSTGQIQGIVWRPDGSSALIVGNAGTLLEFRSGTITILSSGTTSDLYSAAWNPNSQYAIIAGSGGLVFRWNGTTAIPINTVGLYSASLTIRGIAWNSAGTRAVLVGTQGLILAYDGTNLSGVTANTSSNLYSAAWSGNTVTIVGNGGIMLVDSGTGRVQSVATNVTSNFRGIAG